MLAFVPRCSRTKLLWVRCLLVSSLNSNVGFTIMTKRRPRTYSYYSKSFMMMNGDHLLPAAFLILYLVCPNPGRSPKGTKTCAPKASRNRCVPTFPTPNRPDSWSINLSLSIVPLQATRCSGYVLQFGAKNGHFVHHFYPFSCVSYRSYYESVKRLWTCSILESIWPSWLSLMDSRRNCLSLCLSCTAALAFWCVFLCPSTWAYFVHVPFISICVL